MAYRNKTYIAFDGDNDMTYFNTLKMWSENKSIDFDFFNAHEICSARDSSLTESIKSSLRIRLQNSKVFILLIGDKTKYLHKFVEWEIKEAIKMNIPIIGVNINKSNEQDEFCPVILRNELAVFVPFQLTEIRHAMYNWPEYLKNNPTAKGKYSYPK
jgi:hypothetical protein